MIVREVREDPDTFLRYFGRLMLAFVLSFVQEMTPAGEEEMQALASALIDATRNHD